MLLLPACGSMCSLSCSLSSASGYFQQRMILPPPGLPLFGYPLRHSPPGTCSLLPPAACCRNPTKTGCGKILEFSGKVWKFLELPALPGPLYFAGPTLSFMTTLHYTTLHTTLRLHYTALRYTTQHYTTHYSPHTTLHNAPLCYATLQQVTLQYTTLHTTLQ